MESIEDKLRELEEKRKGAALGGGQDATKKQHDRGKLTARERIEVLLDPGSFVEIGGFVQHRCVEFGMEKRELPGDAVVTGHGRIDGRVVYVYAEDFTQVGGTIAEMHAMKICNVIKSAAKAGVPVVGLYDSGGARIQEGVDSLKGVGDILYQNVMTSGAVPQIAVVMGPSAGGAVYSPALCDFVVMVKKTSYMFITGPAVTKSVTGEEVTFEQLGGSDVHAETAGTAHVVAEDDAEALRLVRKLLSYLPPNNLDESPTAEVVPPKEGKVSLNQVVPLDPRKLYDIRDVILGIVDGDSFFELQSRFAPNLVVGFARLQGKTIGLIANQPLSYAGTLDINASDKLSRFVRFCDAFNIPLVSLVDVPGYLPGVRQEHGGIIRHGAKVIYAYSEASVPKITVILRKAYGGAYIAMCSRHLGADLVLAWPSAEIAVMGAEGAVEILYKDAIAKAKDPQALIQSFTKEYGEKFASPYLAAARGYVDQVVKPEETRSQLVQALDAMSGKRDIAQRQPVKHGNTPL